MYVNVTKNLNASSVYVVKYNYVCFVVDTKFKQQRLPAWQPVMSAGSVLPILFAVGIAFIPLGIAFLITANNVGPFCNYLKQIVFLILGNFSNNILK